MQSSIARRWFAVPVLVLALLGSVQAPASAAESRRERMHDMINASRAAQGLRGLRLNDRLSKVALAHSKAMAAEAHAIFHSCLTCSIKSFSWSIAGENVGEGPRLSRVHKMFMNSPSHRANILAKSYRKVGVGVVRASGRVWVTEIFLG